jgi:hypothetical protein
LVGDCGSSCQDKDISRILATILGDMKRVAMRPDPTPSLFFDYPLSENGGLIFFASIWRRPPDLWFIFPCGLIITTFHHFQDKKSGRR